MIKLNKNQKEGLARLLDGIAISSSIALGSAYGDYLVLKSDIDKYLIGSVLLACVIASLYLRKD